MYMKYVANRFGCEKIYQFPDIMAFTDGHVKFYVACTACLSVYTDFLSFIERHSTENHKVHFEFSNKLDSTITHAIVLSCQVTDLAILNDITVMRSIHDAYPNVEIYCGGCLAQRFDIDLPSYVKRFGVLRNENTPLSEETFKKVDYRKPFWNKDLSPNEPDLLAVGNLFRHYYPLKTGAGCHGKCKYCTIRDTRGTAYETHPYDQVDEFLDHRDVVLVSDAPSAILIKEWCNIATRNKKNISFRNVEPTVAVACKKELLELSQNRLLDIFHCPIQSLNYKVLEVMNRDIRSTYEFIDLAQELSKWGTIIATNIIIDYKDATGNIMPDDTKNIVGEIFDYYSWNPYFDGIYNEQTAKERFKKYLGYELPDIIDMK